MSVTHKWICLQATGLQIVCLFSTSVIILYLLSVPPFFETPRTLDIEITLFNNFEFHLIPNDLHYSLTHQGMR